MTSIARRAGLTVLTTSDDATGATGPPGPSEIVRCRSTSRPVTSSRSISRSLRSMPKKRPGGFGHPGGGFGPGCSVLRRVPEREAGERLVLIDVGVAPRAEDELPREHVAGASGVVWRVVRRGALAERADEGRLEGPELGAGPDRRHSGHRGAPRAGELRAARAVAVEHRHVARVADALVPAVDEGRVDVGCSRARLARRLDVDREHAPARDAQVPRGRYGRHGVAVAGRVR